MSSEDLNSLRQDTELRIQNLKNLIDPKWLAPEPPVTLEDLNSFSILLTRLSDLEKLAGRESENYEKEFVRRGRMGFRLVFYTTAFWFLLAKLILVPAIPSLVLSFFLTLTFMWIQWAEERKSFDRKNRERVSQTSRDQTEMGRLGLIKQEIEKKYNIPDLNSQVVESWLEDYHLWLRHDQERLALLELTLKLKELSD